MKLKKSLGIKKNQKSNTVYIFKHDNHLVLKLIFFDN
jgi:hypothetical protein